MSCCSRPSGSLRTFSARCSCKATSQVRGSPQDSRVRERLSTRSGRFLRARAHLVRAGDGASRLRVDALAVDTIRDLARLPARSRLKDYFVGRPAKRPTDEANSRRLRSAPAAAVSNRNRSRWTLQRVYSRLCTTHLSPRRCYSPRTRDRLRTWLWRFGRSNGRASEGAFGSALGRSPRANKTAALSICWWFRWRPIEASARSRRHDRWELGHYAPMAPWVRAGVADLRGGLGAFETFSGCTAPTR